MLPARPRARPTIHDAKYDRYRRVRCLNGRWRSIQIMRWRTPGSRTSAWLVMWFAGSQSDLREAEKESARALELTPDLAESRVSRGQVLMLARNYDDAEEHFRRAIELNPRSFEAHYYYGRLLFSQGRILEAEPMLHRATDLHPEDFQTPCSGGSASRRCFRRCKQCPQRTSPIGTLPLK